MKNTRTALLMLVFLISAIPLTICYFLFLLTSLLVMIASWVVPHQRRYGFKESKQCIAGIFEEWAND